MRALVNKCECGGWITPTFIEERNEKTMVKEIVLNDLKCIDCNKATIVPFMTEREFWGSFKTVSIFEGEK